MHSKQMLKAFPGIIIAQASLDISSSSLHTVSFGNWIYFFSVALVFVVYSEGAVILGICFIVLITDGI